MPAYVTGYDGDLCEKEVNECTSDPCQNGGICVDGTNKFYCECLQSYSGTLCQNIVGVCKSSPCVHGM